MTKLKSEELRLSKLLVACRGDRKDYCYSGYAHNDSALTEVFTENELEKFSELISSKLDMVRYHIDKLISETI